jgi:NADPH-dependent ferric siderophore reductase
MSRHEIARVRRDVVRRTLRVASKTYITPRMLRIVFQSSELVGFDSPSPDDHVKIFLPARGDAAPVARDFTPRAWDLEAGTLTLDFALHENGPATDWAREAQVGHTLGIGGPRGSTIVPDDFDWYLLIGDATALPSIGRRVESLRAGVLVSVFALVADGEEQQRFATAASCTAQWLTSSENAQQDAAALCAALERFQAPAGDGFIWIAAEVSVARELYNYVVKTLQHPKQWVKAAGYWSLGQADGGENIV